MALSQTSRPDLGNLKCQASIEASVDCLDLSQGRLVVPEEACLFGLLSQCVANIQAIFNLSDPHGILAEPSTLERILSAIFDTNSLAFVTEKTVRILAGLNDHDKSCLFVQAVAGIAMVFQRLSRSGTGVSAGLLSRELQLFAESEQRQEMLDKIAGSSLFSSCYAKSSVVDLVTAAMEEKEIKHNARLPLNRVEDDLLSGRPCKNMGLPWGFTIMALN